MGTVRRGRVYIEFLFLVTAAVPICFLHSYLAGILVVLVDVMIILESYWT